MTGESAIEAALIHPPELLVTDLVLPGMNGIELAITLRPHFSRMQGAFDFRTPIYYQLDVSAGIGRTILGLLSKPLHAAEFLNQLAMITNVSLRQSLGVHLAAKMGVYDARWATASSLIRFHDADPNTFVPGRAAPERCDNRPSQVKDSGPLMVSLSAT